MGRAFPPRRAPTLVGNAPLTRALATNAALFPINGIDENRNRSGPPASFAFPPLFLYIRGMLPFITLITGRQKNGLPTWVNKDCTNLPCTNLSRRNLKGLNLSRTDMFKTNLGKCDLSGTNLSQAYLFKANLAGANLSRANLKGANLRDADLTGADLNGTELRFALFDENTLLPFSREEALARGMVLDEVPL